MKLCELANLGAIKIGDLVFYPADDPPNDENQLTMFLGVEKNLLIPGEQERAVLGAYGSVILIAPCMDLTSIKRVHGVYETIIVSRVEDACG